MGHISATTCTCSFNPVIVAFHFVHMYCTVCGAGTWIHCRPNLAEILCSHLLTCSKEFCPQCAVHVHTCAVYMYTRIYTCGACMFFTCACWLSSSLHSFVIGYLDVHIPFKLCPCLHMYLSIFPWSLQTSLLSCHHLLFIYM